MIHVLRSLLMVVHLKRGRTLGPELYHLTEGPYTMMFLLSCLTCLKSLRLL